MIINEERRKIQEEALEALEKNNYNSFVILPTGTGKSYIMIECLKRLSEKLGKVLNILYLCNSTDLRDKGFKDELIKWGAEEFIESIDFRCYQTARKYINKHWNVVLADEADFALSEQYSKVFFNNTFDYKILVSATIDDKKLSLAKQIAPIVYQKELADIEQSGVLNKSKYFFVNFKMSADESLEYEKLNKNLSLLINEKQNFPSKRTEFKLNLAIYARKHFLNTLKSSENICKKLLKEIYETDKNAKTLIFCEITEQADRVSEWTYHSKSEQSSLDNFDKSRNGTLAVCGKVDRGVNIVGVNYIIYESCNSSKTKLTQRLGRGKRLKIDENLNVYFLVPYFRKMVGSKETYKPTKILDWIENAARDLDLSQAQVYKFRNQ